MKTFWITQAVIDFYGIEKLAGYSLLTPECTESVSDDDTVILLPDDYAFSDEFLLKKTVIFVIDNPYKLYFTNPRIRKVGSRCICKGPEAEDDFHLFSFNYSIAATEKEFFQQIQSIAPGEHIDIFDCRPLHCSYTTVLLLTPSLHTGGMEHVIYGLCDTMLANGLRPILGYTETVSEEAKGYLHAKNLPYYQIPLDSDAQKEFLENMQVDIVNAHYSMEMTEACNALHIPYVQTIHNTYLWNNAEDTAYWWYRYAQMDAFISVSYQAAQVATQRYGAPAKKMRIIENGARALGPVTQRPEDVLAALGIPENSAVFLHVASLLPIKMQDVVLEAYVKAFSKSQDVFVLFAGSGHDEAYAHKLKEMASSLGIEHRIRFLGYQENIQDYLQITLALLLPSVVEGWSLCIDEARQANIRIIATRTGGADSQLVPYRDLFLPAFFPITPDTDASQYDFESYPEHKNTLCAELASAMGYAVTLGKAEPLPEYARPVPADTVFIRHLKALQEVYERVRNGASSAA